MRVWRIECPVERMGPWTAKRGVNGALEYIDGHSPDYGPSPSEDCDLELWGRHRDLRGAGAICVCETIEQLGRWFRRPHRENLEEAGYVLAEYEVDGRKRKGRKGCWQSVFIRSDLRHVTDHKPTMVNT